MQIATFRREENLDVEIAASGFTKDLESRFDEVSSLYKHIHK